MPTHSVHTPTCVREAAESSARAGIAPPTPPAWRGERWGERCGEPDLGGLGGDPGAGAMGRASGVEPTLKRTMNLPRVSCDARCSEERWS